MAPLVEEVEDVRLSLEPTCCFVSTFEEDHLEKSKKRGVVGREEAGDEHSDMEFVREPGTLVNSWKRDGRSVALSVASFS
jgi:hypothetical protein